MCSQACNTPAKLVLHMSQKHGIRIQSPPSLDSLLPKSAQAPTSTSAGVEQKTQEQKTGTSGGSSEPFKIKFHMFQPEMMRFTSDNRKLFQTSDGIDTKGLTLADLKFNEPPGKKLKFVDLTPTIAPSEVLNLKKAL